METPTNRVNIEGDAEAIVAGILSWAADPNSTQHCTITGGPGAGKTWLLRLLMQKWADLEELKVSVFAQGLPQLSATSHEMKERLNDVMKDSSVKDIFGMSIEAKTIHSICHISPHKGRSVITVGRQIYTADDPLPNNATTWAVGFVICDESNYIDKDMLTLISKWCPGLRIIFVGSENQLSIGSGKSPIFTQGYSSYLLNTKWRASNADVQAVYDQTEQDVINNQYTPIVDNPSVVYMDEETWLASMKNAYTTPDVDVVTIAYRRERVFELNCIIRKMQGKFEAYDIGSPTTQTLYAGSKQIPKKGAVPTFVQDQHGNNLPAFHIKPNSNKATARDYFSYVASSLEEYRFYKQKHNQTRTKETYPTLLCDTLALTAHGAQGMTVDYVFLDLVDLNRARQWSLDAWLRLLHVGMSRQRIKVYLNTGPKKETNNVTKKY